MLLHQDYQSTEIFVVLFELNQLCPKEKEKYK
jgi:hypothetical protein